MKSAASEPIAYPGLTRLRHNGRDYVALGTWTDAQMIAAIKQTRSAIPARNHGRMCDE